MASLANRWLRHRGPDGAGATVLGRSALAHTRLAIVDPGRGAQPMFGENNRTALVCNGEIYNHIALRQDLRARHHFRTRSDSEVVVHLYEDAGSDCVAALDGMFAFFVTNGEKFAAARDPLGIKPLYFGRTRAGELVFASELKALAGDCESFAALPPGSVLTESGHVKRWFVPAWADRVGTIRDPLPSELLERLEQSVVKRLMSDVPMGVFLSGGLDSTLVAALASAHLGAPKSFAVGVADGTDLEAARLAASALGTVHYETTYALSDVARELERIIFHLESYDPALVRSAVPCYFLAKLAAEHVKVVLTGEGADELFGGYAHFAGITDAAAVHRECAQLLLGLHAMNLQRLDRMTMAHGLEGRVPFLDTAFVDWCMNLDPASKLRQQGVPEKLLLRQAATRLVPPEIVKRPKLEFAHGSGGNGLLRYYAGTRIADGELARARQRFPVDPPTTKEEVLYRQIFDGLFPGAAAQRTVSRWKPNRTPQESGSR